MDYIRLEYGRICEYEYGVCGKGYKCKWKTQSKRRVSVQVGKLAMDGKEESRCALCLP